MKLERMVVDEGIVEPHVWQAVCRAAWRWYRLNNDAIIGSVFWKKFRVRDVRGFFVHLFGPEPVR